MVIQRKLVRNGNSTHLALPRAFLRHLQWFPGRQVCVELLEDNTLWVRPATVKDLENAVAQNLARHGVAGVPR